MTCRTPIYRRPKELILAKRRFCNKQCESRFFTQKRRRKCEGCQKLFDPPNKMSWTCSRSCSNKARKGIRYKHGSERHSNRSERLLQTLREAFGNTGCMVSGCGYNITLDVHRFIPGKDGGQYEIGNMFAICPNHHAEVTRGKADAFKVSNCELLMVAKTEGIGNVEPSHVSKRSVTRNVFTPQAAT